MKKAAAVLGIKPGNFSEFVEAGKERVKQLNKKVVEDDKRAQEILKNSEFGNKQDK